MGTKRTQGEASVLNRDDEPAGHPLDDAHMRRCGVCVCVCVCSYLTARRGMSGVECMWGSSGGSTQAVGLVRDGEEESAAAEQQSAKDDEGGGGRLAVLPAPLRPMFEALYMRSHLGLGANHMESAVLDALVAEMPPGTDEIPNPCGAHITLSYAPFIHRPRQGLDGGTI